MILEGENAVFQIRKRRKVVGRQDLSLEDREVDLNLVKPAGMHGSMHEDQVLSALLKTLHAGLASMR